MMDCQRLSSDKNIWGQIEVKVTYRHPGICIERSTEYLGKVWWSLAKTDRTVEAQRTQNPYV